MAISVPSLLNILCMTTPQPSPAQGLSISVSIHSSAADAVGLVGSRCVVEADHHADLGAVAQGGKVGAHPFPVAEAAHVVGQRRVEAAECRARGEGEAPEAVDAADRADEVRVADVGERAEVRGLPALGRDAAARAHPLPRLLCVGRWGCRGW